MLGPASCLNRALNPLKDVRRRRHGRPRHPPMVPGPVPNSEPAVLTAPIVVSRQSVKGRQSAPAPRPATTELPFVDHAELLSALVRTFDLSRDRIVWEVTSSPRGGAIRRSRDALSSA